MKRLFFLLAVTCVLCTFPKGVSASIINFDNSDLSGWYTDRLEPAEFVTEIFQGDNRLRIGIDGNDQQANSFYNFQGKKYDFGDDIYSYRIVGDLYVGDGWKTGDWNVGMWGTTMDSADNVTGYPIIAYRNGRDVNAGFYGFDYINGTWFSLKEVSEFQKWYSLEMVYNRVELNYFIDGDNVGTFADSYEQDNISNIFLNSYNFGKDYNVYWDNVGTSVPVPSTALLLGAAILGLAGIGRKKIRQ